MGISLYLKNYTDSQGKSQLEIKCRSRGQHYSKALFKITRDSWDSKRQRILATNQLAAKYNPQIAEIKENMYNSFDLYEAGIYSFEELKRRLNGGSSKLDMLSFAEDVYKDYKQVSYNNILNALKAWKKAMNTDSLLFTDMNYTTMTATISKLKQTHAPSSVNGYIGFLSSVTNEAYRRGVINDKFISYRQYYQKVGTKIVNVATTEQFREAITKVTTIYQFQALSFWLLSFCLRGLYPKDLIKLHLNKFENEDDSELKRYILHRRSKTNEVMDILYSVSPTESILATLQQSLIHTHKIDNRGTMKLFNYDPENYRDHKHTWSTYGINIKNTLGHPLKTARKTVESIAVRMDISSALRYRLLGHADTSVKSHYISWQWTDLRDKVDAAHIDILKEFQAEELWNELSNVYYDKLTNDERGVYIGPQ